MTSKKKCMMIKKKNKGKRLPKTWYEASKRIMEDLPGLVAFMTKKLNEQIEKKIDAINERKVEFKIDPKVLLKSPLTRAKRL